jgi:hypothetical protein
MTRKKYAIISGSVCGFVTTTAITGINLLLNRPFDIIDIMISFIVLTITWSLYMADVYLKRKGENTP